MNDLTKKRILIVDDSFIMRRLVRELVEGDPDFEVVDTAEDGRIALQKVRSCKPDLVLLDIEMPEMSGLETMRRLGLRSKSKIVILSSLGGADTPETAEALRLGAAAVLEKPSGSISLDLQARKGSEIVRTMRSVLDLPALDETPVTAADETPLASAEPASGGAQTLLFDALLNGLQTGVLVFNSAGRLRVSNAAALRLLGREGTVPQSLTLDLLFDQYNEGILADLRDVLASGAPFGPELTDFALPDGAWRPLRLTASRLTPEEGETQVLVLLEDATREKELKTILSRTLSDTVATQILAGQSLNLGGTLQQTSILFSDIRSFTTLSEELGAAGIVETLNEYFSFMEDVIKQNGGVIDKYIGDAIMALFGVPARLGQDHDRAVQAGLAMLAALEVLNKDRQRRGHRAIKIGIGISTGQVIAGSIGSPTRSNYTVIGDAVNLAARIESLTKHYGAAFMICGQTLTRLERPIVTRLIDKVQVKGQSAETALHQVFSADTPINRDLFDAYAQAFQAYSGGNWASALTLLEQALALAPDDRPSLLIQERCQTLLAAPPKTWAGVWTYHE
jgi:class 3 adenylate cyclase/ActR/RegA family two-component response regulator